MRISDWSSDVCSSDLHAGIDHVEQRGVLLRKLQTAGLGAGELQDIADQGQQVLAAAVDVLCVAGVARRDRPHGRSEEHTSELQSLMRISYAVFCLKKKKKITISREICIYSIP